MKAIDLRVPFSLNLDTLTRIALNYAQSGLEPTLSSLSRIDLLKTLKVEVSKYGTEKFNFQGALSFNLSDSDYDIEYAKAEGVVKNRLHKDLEIKL